MFGSNFRDFVSQDAALQDQSSSERLIKSWHGFEKPDSEDSGIEEEFEVLDSESQEIPATPCSTSPEDLSLENAILANFPDGCDRSFTVELKDEDSYGIIPKNLTFAEIINILNQAIQEDNCEELDKVVQNIEDYEGRSITLDNENLKDFCSNQLNLELQNRSNHQHIYSNVLSQYKFDQEGFKYDYSVKELVLLAIAANDKLVEQYQDFLFAEENLSLLPLLVGNQKYIEAFIEKFHGTDGVYGRLKGQAIQLVKSDKIDFFSVIALRKEQELLNAVFVEYVLRDFGQVLKTSKPDPLYGVLETASLIKNEEFITIVLGAFERYINEPTKKASTEELLKKSFATLLETAISQEHISVIKYLCKRYTNSADHAIYDVYEQAFADDKVITILKQQILKNIGARGRKEIYDLILKTALDAGNIAFIEHLCEKCAECSNDVINYLDHKLKNNEFDNTCESTLVALSNVKNTNTDVIVEVLFYTKEIHQNASHNEQVIRQVIQNILKNATHYSIGQEDYSLVKEVCYLYTEEGAINVIFQEECKIFKSSIEKRIEDLEKENKLLQSEALREYNYSYLPGIVNGLAQTAYIAYNEYTKDPKDNKRQKNIDLIFSLMQIRNILQFSIDVQEYPCHKRQDLWDEMYQTPGTFIIRKGSNNVADELEIPVITSDILSENPGLESAGSQQPQENVDRRENIMNNEKASIEELISNSFEEGEMGKSSKKKGVRPLASPVKKKISEIISKGNDNLNLEEEFKNILMPNNRDSVLKYVKNQEGPFRDEVVTFLTIKKNEKNGAQINGKQPTNPNNTVPLVQPAPSKNASSDGSNVPKTEDVTNSKDMPVINGASSKDDCEFESDQSDDEHSSEYVVTPSGSGSSSPIQDIVNEEGPVESIIDSKEDSALKGSDSLQDTQPETSDGEHEQNSAQPISMPGSEDQKQTPVQLAVYVPEETTGLKEQPSNIQEQSEVPETSVSGQTVVTQSKEASSSVQNDLGLQNKSANSSSVDSDEEKQASDQSDKRTVRISKQASPNNEVFDDTYDTLDTTNSNGEEPVENIIDSKEDSTLKDNDSLKNIQLETSDDNGEREQSSAQLINMLESEDQKQTPVQLAGHVSQKDDNKKDTQPKPAPAPTLEPVSPVANNKSEQVNDTQTNGKLPNNPGNGSITATQNTQKSKWPTVAIWTLAVAGILAGAAAPAAYFAFSVSLLTTGIIAGVGVCCLAAAAIIYCCNRPSSSFKGSNVEPVANGKLVEQQ